ncbi:ubiquitin-like protein Pup [Micrococcus antarcticus]
MTQESFSARRSTQNQQAETEQVQVNTTGQSTGQSAGVDDLLDEIDSVLESNAEEFVRGFVQKGGQ